ncbi:MAG TPA: hypothetical protein VHY31_17300 [Streptosporangiaceae bacterium]|nr:hypothetical protein [Streptosporangiaceae bacterium]
MRTYTNGVEVWFSIVYSDSANDAEGFGFVGVNGSGWAQEQHPFSSPSYGIVGPDGIAYPFNLGCETGNQQAQLRRSLDLRHHRRSEQARGHRARVRGNRGISHAGLPD